MVERAARPPVPNGGDRFEQEPADPDDRAGTQRNPVEVDRARSRVGALGAAGRPGAIHRRSEARPGGAREVPTRARPSWAGEPAGTRRAPQWSRRVARGRPGRAAHRRARRAAEPDRNERHVGAPSGADRSDRGPRAARCPDRTRRGARRGGLELVTSDPLVRDIARRHGFTGSLRGPLAAGPEELPSWTDDPSGVRDAVQQLLPGIEVGVEADAGAARAFLRRAVSGVSKTFNLLAAPDDDTNPTRFSVPRRSDLLIESVARVASTRRSRSVAASVPSPPPPAGSPSTTRTSSCSTASTRARPTGASA